MAEEKFEEAVPEVPEEQIAAPNRWMVPSLPEFHLGMGQTQTTRIWTADVSPCFHVPGLHVGYIICLIHSHFGHSACWVWWPL